MDGKLLFDQPSKMSLEGGGWVAGAVFELETKMCTCALASLGTPHLQVPLVPQHAKRRSASWKGQRPPMINFNLPNSRFIHNDQPWAQAWVA